MFKTSLALSMKLDSFNIINEKFNLAWIHMVEHGIADSSIVENPPIICPDFGQPGWAPFCFLNGNPVFNAFDSFQAFVQGSVVQLHDLLQVSMASWILLNLNTK